MQNPEINWFFQKPGKWQEAYLELREIVLSTGLSEAMKWGCPCYSDGQNNIVLIHGFKDYCALLFMQGALLSDPKKMPVQQTKNVQAARQLRFTALPEIIKNKTTIRNFIREAVKNARDGKKVVLKETDEFDMPAEFASALKEMPDLKKAFYKLTPGRQRGYLLYFSAAKQEKTRMQRVEKYIPVILAGKGLEDE